MKPDSVFKVNRPNIVYELIEGEVVIVNLMKGDYYSLVKAGAVIWEDLAGGMGVDLIARDIASRYDASDEEAVKATRDLIRQLENEGLVMLSADLPAVMAYKVKPAERSKFEKPVLQKYTDMEDILLLDPIHDVDESGWPNKAKGK